MDSFLVGKRELVSEGMQELHYGRLCCLDLGEIKVSETVPEAFLGNPLLALVQQGKQLCCRESTTEPWLPLPPWAGLHCLIMATSVCLMAQSETTELFCLSLPLPQ